MTKISIIMTTYNWSKYISQAIDSVFNQSYREFELIIVNDWSTDNVEDIILKYKEKHYNVVYVKNKKNLWAAWSRNEGIRKSSWSYIAILDDDDIRCDKNKLKKQLDFMERNKNYWLCWTNTIKINKDWKSLLKSVFRETDDNIKKHILQSNQFAHSSVIIRKGILDKIGYYDSWWNPAEDYELFLRIWKISKFYNLQDFMLKYRWLETSISRKRWFKQEILTLKAILKYRKNYPNFLKSIILRSWYALLKAIKRILWKK